MAKSTPPLVFLALTQAQIQNYKSVTSECVVKTRDAHIKTQTTSPQSTLETENLHLKPYANRFVLTTSIFVSKSAHFNAFLQGQSKGYMGIVKSLVCIVCKHSVSELIIQCMMFFFFNIKRNAFGVSLRKHKNFDNFSTSLCFKVTCCVTVCKQHANSTEIAILQNVDFVGHVSAHVHIE